MIVLVAIVLPYSPLQADIKCWTNSKNIRECGNALPPEFSQRGYEIVSKHGKVVRLEKIKSRREVEAERLERERLANLREIERLKLMKQRARDNILLTAYPTEADLIRARDKRLEGLNNEIDFTLDRIDKLKAQLKMRQEQIKLTEEPATALDIVEIANINEQVEELTAGIQERLTDRKSLKQQFKVDLKRLKHLLSIKSTTNQYKENNS